jgi:formylglycine-generating enzyme required for sulfatase activity
MNFSFLAAMPCPPIFISHSHYDNTACRQIRDFLHRQLPDADIFLDESELHGGDDWMHRIPHEVIARPIFLVILSRHSIAAEWVAEETNLALARAVKDRTRKIIPVQIDPSLRVPEDIDRLSPLLSMRQIVVLGEQAPQQHWEELVRVVRGEQSNLAHATNPSQAAELEHARVLAAQVHDDFTQGRYRIAAKVGREAVGLPGNECDATLWGDLGMALVATSEADAGLAALETALQLNRQRPDLWRAKARVLMQQQRYGEARQAWDTAFVVTGAQAERPEILAEAFDALASAGQWPLAQEAVADALRLAPDDAAWQARRKQAQLGPLQERYDTAMAAKDWADALAVCREALAIAPGDARWQAQQARVQQILRQEEEARRQEQERRQRDEQAFLAAMLPAVQRVSRGFTGQIVQGHAVIVPPVCEVPAGGFLMGSDKKKDGEVPQHTVTLGAFQIGAYPVTVAEYACAVRAKAVREPPTSGSVSWQTQLQRLDHPVVCVSWRDALAYVRWLAQVTGQPWRLPTEAEWEKAARGTDGRIYPWGNQWDKARANTSDGGPGTTTPIGAYAERGDASPYGAHDLAGDVWEWCSSLYQPYAYNADDGRENLDSTGNRVLRGGSWGSGPGFARAAYRIDGGPGVLGANGGFRLAGGPAA